MQFVIHIFKQKEALLIELLALMMLLTALDNITPVLQGRILRLRDVQLLFQGHPATNQAV